MSDTDDTDLLLLIPPDFFLIHSPDLESFGSECESNFGCDNHEFKDIIVSDLISQVNDLESRLCLIETLDRSGAHCSACNEDSFVNQSVNSLTESDVLRSQTKDPPISVVQEHFEDNFMLKQVESNPKLASELLLKLHGSLPEGISPAEIISNATIEEDINKSLKQDFTRTKPSTCVPKDPPEERSELLREIDSFLDVRNRFTSQAVSIHDDPSFNMSSHKETELDVADQTVSSKENQNRPRSTSEDIVHWERYTGDQSFALPEVYQLLQEMEETQQEIEKKFKVRENQPFVPGNKSIKPTSDRFMLLGNGGKHLDSHAALSVEDLYTRSKPLKKQSPNNILERLKNMHDSKGVEFRNSPVQTSYVPTPISSSGLSEDIWSHKNEPKPKYTSPIRNSVETNSIDIVEANLPTRNFSGSRIGNESPRKSANIRRHLNFERSAPISPLVTKSKPSMHVAEQTTNHTGLGLQQRFDNEIIVKSSKDTRSNNIEKNNQNPSYPGAAKNNPNTKEVGLKQQLSLNNLLSLSELWNKEPTFYSDDPNKLRQKLDEEKYRRQHCEQQIQVLQQRVLEEQEKLAVAIKVDQEKDKAIMQISESWRKLNEHWSDIEEQRHNLSQQLLSEKAEAKARSDELKKKVERWEKEVSQALDLAAGYKEKSEATQKQMEALKTSTEEKLNEVEIQLKNLREGNDMINSENKSLLKQLSFFQERQVEVEGLLSKLKSEVEKSRKESSEFEAELNVLKEQKETLMCKIKDEKNRCSMLEQRTNSLQQSLEEASNREHAALEEARVSGERIEVARTELRALYQGQLETVVKEKLQEFQSQLEAAEQAMKAELQAKEKQWAEKAIEQCHKLEDKLKVDKQRIEEYCKAEVSKWKHRLAESERLRSIIENKLQEETNRRADIAQKLHSVMETQWREALNIISNPMMNAYEQQKEESIQKCPPRQESAERMRGGGEGEPRATRSNSTASLGHVEEAPFCREGVLTYRPQDEELKKYVHMCLERGPNHLFNQESFQESLDLTATTENNFQSNKWMPNSNEDKKYMGQTQRFGHYGKPPWK